MKCVIIILCALLCSACATAQTTIDPAQSGIVAVLIKDFTTAQTNYETAAAAQPAGSDLQAKFTAAGQCMADSANRLRGLQGTGGGSVSGIVSLGSVVYINTLELQAQITARSQSSTACDQLVGQMVRGINSQILRAVPGLLLPRL